MNTRDLYGKDYFRHIASLRKVRRGGRPKGSLRRNAKIVSTDIISKLSPDSQDIFQNMLRMANDNGRISE